MSSKKGLGRLYDRLTPEERFRLNVLALARGDTPATPHIGYGIPRRPCCVSIWNTTSRLKPSILRPRSEGNISGS